MGFTLATYSALALCIIVSLAGNVQEVQISEVSGLLAEVITGSSDLNGVFTSLEDNLEVAYVNTNQVIVAEQYLLFFGDTAIRNATETVGHIEGVGTFLVRVDCEGCCTVCLILPSDMDCHLVDASLIYIYSVKQIVGSLVANIVVSVRTAIALLIPCAVSGALVISGCRYMNYAVLSELFRKCVGHDENVVLFVAISIEERFNFHLNDFYVTVLARAIFYDVLVRLVNIVTNGADTPRTVESFIIIVYITVVAVGFALVTYRALALYIIMSEFCIQLSVTYCANLCSSTGCFRAGSVGELCNLFGLGLVASATSKGLNTRFCTGGFLCYGAVVPNVLVRFVTGSGLFGSGLFGSCLLRSGLFGSGLFGSGLFGSSLLGSGLFGSSLLRSGLFGSGLLGSALFGSALFGSGLLGSGCFGSFGGYFRSGSSLIGLLEQITRNNGEHHSNGKYQSQNAQNVLVFHVENLH